MKKRIVWGMTIAVGLILIATACAFLGNLNPIASFTVTPSQGTSPLDVDFDASASFDPDGTIVEYLWDFGDGQTASETLPTTTYTYTLVQSDSEVFTVILTVTDDLGAEDTAAKNVTVDP